MAKKVEEAPPEPHYNLKRWLEDWEWQTTQGEIPEEDFAAYFAEKYGEHAVYFRERMHLAAAYKRTLIDPMEPGEQKDLVTGQPLVAALYRLYSRCPDDKLQEEYPVELVVSLAREHKPRH